MTTISVYEARANLSKLIERTLAGEEVVITRRGKPVVRLVPTEEPRSVRRPGALKGLFEVPDEFFEPLPDEILDAFYGGSIEPAEDNRSDEEGKPGEPE